MGCDFGRPASVYQSSSESSHSRDGLRTVKRGGGEGDKVGLGVGESGHKASESGHTGVPVWIERVADTVHDIKYYKF